MGASGVLTQALFAMSLVASPPLPEGRSRDATTAADKTSVFGAGIELNPPEACLDQLSTSLMLQLSIETMLVIPTCNTPIRRYTHL